MTEQIKQWVTDSFSPTRPPDSPCKSCGCLLAPRFSDVFGWLPRHECQSCYEQVQAKARAKLISQKVEDYLVPGVISPRMYGKFQHRGGKRPLCKALTRLMEVEGVPYENNWAYLFGVPGTGKTTQLISFAIAVIEKYVQKDMTPPTIKYITESAICADFKSFGRESIAQLVERYSRPRILMIDEAARSQGTEYEKSPWSTVIHTREAEGLMTIFASNFHLQDLLEGGAHQHSLYDRMVTDRITSMTDADLGNDEHRISYLNTQYRLGGKR